MMISWLLGCTWIFHIFEHLWMVWKKITNHSKFDFSSPFSDEPAVVRGETCVWVNPTVRWRIDIQTIGGPLKKGNLIGKHLVIWDIYLSKKEFPLDTSPRHFSRRGVFFFDTRNFGNRALTGHQLFGNLGTVGCRGVGECVSPKNPT